MTGRADTPVRTSCLAREVAETVGLAPVDVRSSQTAKCKLQRTAKSSGILERTNRPISPASKGTLLSYQLHDQKSRRVGLSEPCTVRMFVPPAAPKNQHQRDGTRSDLDGNAQARSSEETGSRYGHLRQCGIPRNKKCVPCGATRKAECRQPLLGEKSCSGSARQRGHCRRGRPQNRPRTQICLDPRPQTHFRRPATTGGDSTASDHQIDAAQRLPGHRAALHDRSHPGRCGADPRDHATWAQKGPF